MTGASQTLAFLEPGIAILLGIGILGGTLGAWLFQKLHIPQVVGYLVFGLVIGGNGFSLLTEESIEALSPFTWCALGLIGFLVGGELKTGAFKKYGRQFLSILIWEGLSAFVCVFAASSAIIFFLTGNLAVSLAAGCIFGAIASATDPASTIDVLWEYRSRGVLTTTLIAIVALDDALAMLLYGTSTGLAGMLTGNGNSLIHQLGHTAGELGISLLAGIAGGVALLLFVRFSRLKKEPLLAVGLGLLLLIVGAAVRFQLDAILITMAMGLVLVNFAPNNASDLFRMIRQFSGPVYVMFFVLVGARVGIADMPAWMWGLIAAYLAGRSAGKITGCFIGAKKAKAPPMVQKYSGTGILSQGGVAIGLAMMAGHHMDTIPVTGSFSLGDVIITTVTTTTLAAQLLGPPMVNFSIKWAGEKNKNLTESDIVATLTSGDAATRTITTLRRTDRISRAISRFATEEPSAYPVVDETGRPAGLLTLTNLKELLTQTDCWDWLLVEDVLPAGIPNIPASMTLSHALALISEHGTGCLPVTDEAQQKVLGILDAEHVKNLISRKLLRLQALG